MKKTLLLGILSCFSLCLVLGVVYAGPTSVSEAIQKSQTFKDVKERVNYLIAKAQALYNSKQYQDAIDVATYILNKIDPNSEKAKSLIEKAKAQLQATAQKALGNVSNKLLGK